MIDISELMIGNYLLADKQIRRVQIIKPNLIVFNTLVGHKDAYRPSAVMPIELNDSIIFQTVYSDIFNSGIFVFEDENVGLKIDIQKYGMDEEWSLCVNGFFVRKILFLHEFQNTHLWLTKTDLLLQYR